jgi:carbonic anhydrase
MSVIDELEEHNRRYAASFAEQHLPTEPALQLAVVACMDSRIDVFSCLGLEQGQAHIIRNAGGVVTDDVIRSLSISQRKLKTREIVLIHHTRCGMQTITDDGFRQELQDATGQAPSFAIESFTDLDADVRQSIARLRSSPFLLHTDSIRGYVYDVETGVLHQVQETAPDA